MFLLESFFAVQVAPGDWRTWPPGTRARVAIAQTPSQRRRDAGSLYYKIHVRSILHGLVHVYACLSFVEGMMNSHKGEMGKGISTHDI